MRASESSSRRVAVIGAGIVGVSAAIWCQRSGHDVVLIDREGPASGTSYGNAGILAAHSFVPVTVPGLVGKAPRMLLDPDAPLFLKLPYLVKLAPWLKQYLSHCNLDDVRRIATALIPILADTVEQHTALSAGTPAEKYIQASDYLYVYKDREAFLADYFTWNIRREFGFDWQEMDRSALESYDTLYKGGTAGYAIKVGDHGRVSDPGRYVQTLAEHFQAQGGKLTLGTAHELIENQGKVSGVRLDGSTVDCDAAIVATGVWSEALTQQLGVKVPMEAEGGYHIELINPRRVPQSPAMIASGKFVATPMDGRLRCAGIVEFGGLKSTRSRKPLDLLKRQVHATFPDIEYDSIDEWLGYRPAPVDSVPLIGEFERLSGAYAGFGHQHVGLTGGPKTGRLLAALISGSDPGIDMTPYRTERFG